MKVCWLMLLLTAFCSFSFGQESAVWMHPNKGQWHENILYQVDIVGGKMYIEADGFTYHLIENPRKDHDHATHNQDELHEDSEVLKQHVVRSKFIGSNWQNQQRTEQKTTAYRNYYLGDEPANWKTEVHSFGKVVFTDFYPQIDLEMDGSSGIFKYSLLVQPNISTQTIKWKIEGADKVSIDSEGNLIIKTSLGTIKESKPIAWTVKNGSKTQVPVGFKLQNNLVSFHFSNGYNPNDTLVIDPNLIFSTYTGATSDNWGMTATPGPNGEMYAGGIIFGTGYPTTVGAVDASYNGGTQNFNITGFDVAISKFSADGSQLLFSTFLGGGANELPESMITDENGDLYVMGITASSNFPLGNSPYQSVNLGGPVSTQNALIFNGSDVFATRFNASGTQLIGSTYIGGSNLDGLNPSNLSYNYGDQFRGEILLHDNSVFFVSHSRSTNFPVNNGTTLSGTQDVVAFRMNTTLSQLIWSTYIGGSGDESGNSIAVSGNGRIYITGGTSSSNLQLTGIDPTYDGNRDGYLIELDPSSGSILTGTYLGFAEYDQSYFVRTDIDNKVYVYGQSQTSWPISNGKFGVVNSGQFIQKYASDLTVVEWTTMIGAGVGEPEISPTAFLISDCYDIFIAGWGGQVNVSGQALHSTSNGFPITSDAYQSVTNGSNFYLAILSQDAEDLVYGTFIGGLSSSSNHVDGGTSRFDKSGAVYHAVCASCGGNSNGFMSSPGAWSTTNNSTNCNMAAFKFQLGLPYSLSASTTVCDGASTQLSASGGVSYTWTPAASLNNPNIANPIASPTETTVYYVEMDFNEGCAITDSIVVEVIHKPVVDLMDTENICINDVKNLTASGGDTYLWSPNIAISGINTATVSVSPPVSMFYYVTVGNACFDRQDSIWVEVHPLPEIILVDDTVMCVGNSIELNPIGNMQATWTPDATLQTIPNGNAIVNPTSAHTYFVSGTDQFGCTNTDSVLVSMYNIPEIHITPDTNICDQTSIQLTASGGISYSWTPSETLSNASISNPIATPNAPTTYTVETTYAVDCKIRNSVDIDLLYLPIPNVPDTIIACHLDTKTITASGAESYVWSPPTYLNTTVGPTVSATIIEDMTYTIVFTNICGSVSDSVFIDAIFPFVEAFGDTIICPGETTQLFATGSQNYEWNPSNTLSSPFTSSVIAKPIVPTMYLVTGTDSYGCKKVDSVFVDLFPQPYIIASPDQFLLEGDTAAISGTTASSGVVYWSPTEYLSCVMCTETLATPPSQMQYFVTIVDENGCKDSDDVWIYFKPLVYVPNTFTPQGDNFNESYRVIAGNITDFDWMIFNRWGELIYHSTDVTEGWNGMYKGKDCQDGTYTWKLKYNDLQGNEYKHVGHVNILR